MALGDTRLQVIMRLLQGMESPQISCILLTSSIKMVSALFLTGYQLTSARTSLVLQPLMEHVSMSIQTQERVSTQTGEQGSLTWKSQKLRTSLLPMLFTGSASSTLTVLGLMLWHQCSTLTMARRMVSGYLINMVTTRTLTPSSSLSTLTVL